MLTPLETELEAILLVAGEMATIESLSLALDISSEALEKALEALQSHYGREGHGIALQRLGSRVQLVTAPQHGRVVSRFLGVPERAKLTPAVLETLAIVAYRQPVTRPEVEVIRGVNSDYAMKALLESGLIEERGRAESPGHPAFYATSAGFLAALGLRSLEDLPTLDLSELPVSQ